MNGDFHYYATYCAAALAGYSHEECEGICYSAMLVDHCSRTFLKKVGGPASAATTQLQSELVDVRTDLFGVQDITRIWASFHFLPHDLHADVKQGSKLYKNKYRLICGPNGELVKKTVNLAFGQGNAAAGLAMHVLADTWAHAYFAGTPSLVINNTDYNFYELLLEDGKEIRRKITFNHNPGTPDNIEKGKYTNSIYQSSERSIMNLGHGRAGHLPDYSFVRYAYVPAWGDYQEIIKDNPHDYLHAFAQMVYALQYLHGDIDAFETGTYAWDTIAPYEETVRNLLSVRRTDDSEDWKSLGEKITGQSIRDFNLEEYEEAYKNTSSERRSTDTFLGQFFEAALRQKKMVGTEIADSGNYLAGFIRTIRRKHSVQEDSK